MGVFAIFPLMNSQEDFNETVILKIKFSFCFLWLIMSGALISMAINDFRKYFISIIAFFLLKVYSYFYVYKRIKYHDDGSWYVSRAEFWWLHCTYSIVHGWISFYFLHAWFAFLTSHYNNSKINENLGWFALLLLMFENCINISYYKDVIFSLEIWVFYLGIFYNQFDYPTLKEWGEALFSISLIFMVITLCHSWKSSFYTKYSSYVKKLQEVGDTEKNDHIGNDVKFWLSESIAHDN